MTRFLAIFISLCVGASVHSANFRVVYCDANLRPEELLRELETARIEMAVKWIGWELRAEQHPCEVVCRASQSGQGVTVYQPGSPPVDFRMELSGTRDQLINDVIPHEVTHMVLAHLFGCVIPRWADEGACTTEESDDYQRKKRQELRDVLTSGRGIPMNQILTAIDYPSDVSAFYGQSFSIVSFLISQGGRAKFVNFVKLGMERRSWTEAIQTIYQYSSIQELQDTWLQWVAAGSPEMREIDNHYAYQCATGCQQIINGQCVPYEGTIIPWEEQDHSRQIIGQSILPVVPAQPAPSWGTSTQTLVLPREQIESIVQQVSSILRADDSLRGKPGRDGRDGAPGQDGKDGEVTSTHLSRIASAVLDQIHGDPSFRGEPGPPPDDVMVSRAVHNYFAGTSRPMQVESDASQNGLHNEIRGSIVRILAISGPIALGIACLAWILHRRRGVGDSRPFPIRVDPAV